MDAVKEIRRRKGWSQKDLAEESGVGQDTISGIESGRHEPRPSTLRKLADALDVEVADFFREPAVPLAEAPREAGLAAAEHAGFIEGLAAAVDSVADRIQKRSEQTSGTDGDALVALLEDAWIAHRGAEQLLDEVNEEAAQQHREPPAERRARAKLEHAVMRLVGLAENTISGLLEGTEELEWAEEGAKLFQWDEERRRRRAG